MPADCDALYALEPGLDHSQHIGNPERRAKENVLDGPDAEECNGAPLSETPKIVANHRGNESRRPLEEL
jgi:hypothetical protein